MPPSKWPGSRTRRTTVLVLPHHEFLSLALSHSVRRLWCEAPGSRTNADVGAGQATSGPYCRVVVIVDQSGVRRYSLEGIARLWGWDSRSERRPLQDCGQR